VEAFREAEKMLYIDPGVCIDCEACVPACPVEAIFLDENVPPQWQRFIAENAKMAPTLPMINQKKTPLV
jgi:ferredoxin